MIIKHAVIMSNRLQSVIFQQVITHTFVIAELIRTHRILTEDNSSKYLLKNEFNFFFYCFVYQVRWGRASALIRTSVGPAPPALHT